MYERGLVAGTRPREIGEGEAHLLLDWAVGREVAAGDGVVEVQVEGAVCERRHAGKELEDAARRRATRVSLRMTCAPGFEEPVRVYEVR